VLLGDGERAFGVVGEGLEAREAREGKGRERTTHKFNLCCQATLDCMCVTIQLDTEKSQKPWGSHMKQIQ
jgi:hypothetical protein